MRKYLLHSLSFFPLIFGDFFAVRASRKKFIVCATNYCCRPGIGLGWAAGQIDRWLFFFWFSLFFSYRRLVERGRCVNNNNNNNNNNVTRVDSSRSLSLVMMVIIIIIITILVNYYYYYVPSSIQKKKKSRPLRVH